MQNQKLLIREARQFHLKQTGEKISWFSIAKKWWPESTEQSQRQNISNLVNGHTKRISPDQINYLCELFGITRDQIMGYAPFEENKQL